MTHIAYTVPPKCSGCYQQELDSRHVDFGAAWDGPVIEDGQPPMFMREFDRWIQVKPQTDPDGVLKTAIDDLILCERCIAEAAKLLGWKTDDVSEDIARDKAEIVRLKAENAGLKEYAGKQEDLIAKGREVGRVAKPKGRPIKRPEVLNA